MLKKTHMEGGKTAYIGTCIVCLAVYPLKEMNYWLLLIAGIVIFNTCMFASTMKDLDHNEKNMPTRGLVSYCFHCLANTLDKCHRSIITHNILVDIVFWLLPSIWIWYNGFKLPSTIEVNYLVFCTLVSMFSGNLAHYILDKFTVEGAYRMYAVFVLFKYKIQGKDIRPLRKGLRSNFILKKHATLITTKRPFIRRIPVKDYGKTGGQYESIFNVNLQSLNHMFAVVVMFLACKPDWHRFIQGITDVFGNIIK